jgi:dual specificity tyrosine-phosphorylation-regulated kinase 2/3/4
MKILDHDHIAYRYEIKYLLGKGSFGQVFKAFDHKLKQVVALKVIKNKPKYNTQALVEIKILKYINEMDSKQTSNVVEIIDSFVFRGHSVLIYII